MTTVRSEVGDAVACLMRLGNHAKMMHGFDEGNFEEFKRQLSRIVKALSTDCIVIRKPSWLTFTIGFSIGLFIDILLRILL